MNKRLSRLNGERLNEVLNSCTARLDKRSFIAKIHQTLFPLLFLLAKFVIQIEKRKIKRVLCQLWWISPQVYQIFLSTKYWRIRVPPPVSSYNLLLNFIPQMVKINRTSTCLVQYLPYLHIMHFKGTRARTWGWNLPRTWASLKLE